LPGSGVASPSSRTESPEWLKEETQPCSSRSLPVVKTSKCAHDPENYLRIERMTPNSQRKLRLHQWHFWAITLCRYLPGGGRSGQPGNPGAHNGIGLVAVADWWLGRNRTEECETEAAATPTKTIKSPKRRIASFIVSNLSGTVFIQEVSPCTVTE
jgi:hypothetical protein